ncbi:hypothetical protein [Rheinheimera gaetbuli]
MATLINITEKTPDAIQIWGFHQLCNKYDVAKAVEHIASQLNGANHTIHIMSGTHGYCNGRIGAVADREEKFAKEDRCLASPVTADGKAVKLKVHDFNTDKLQAPDYVSAAMAKLNSDIRNIVHSSSGVNTFILAYCCSAGTV